MNYVEIKLPKCKVFLTRQEISNLLAKDPELFETAIKRGKAFTRAEQRENRIQKKRLEEGDVT